MRSAISPNYIHSLDAELLRRVAVIMSECGVNDTDWIHDSFGAHPNDIDFLLDTTKAVFIRMMQANPLMVLDKELREQCQDNTKTQKELSQIKVPNLGGKESIDFNAVLDSEWFFS
jgi:DNA-directed RNA polymerase